MPTWGVDTAPAGGLRIFVDLSEHECQVAGVDQSAEPAPAEPAPAEPAPAEPAPSEQPA
jgi:hypothetical protein